MKTILLLALISYPICISFPNRPEFCLNSDPIVNIFSMEYLTWVQKGVDYYSTLVPYNPLGKASPKPLSNLFSFDFDSLTTAFVVSPVPDCQKSTENCEDLKKLNETGFAIVNNRSASHQLYISCRFSKIGNQGKSPPFLPITNPTEMPFKMGTEGKIEGKFWPKPADDKTVYLHSTYDTKTFGLLHAIDENGKTIVYFHKLTNKLDDPWTKFEDFSIIPKIKMFKGFYQLLNKPEPPTTWLMVKVFDKYVGHDVDAGLWFDSVTPFSFQSFEILTKQLLGECDPKDYPETTTLRLEAKTTFCENQLKIDTLFSLGSVTFARKGALYYHAYLTLKPFLETMGQHESEYFKLDWVSISTGFMITNIPDCDPLSSHCDDLNKILNIAFVIGKKYDNGKQIYAAVRLTKSNSLWEPIEDQKDMPFRMNSMSTISGRFWPKPASEETVYLHSTYDPNSFSIVHLIAENGQKVLFVNTITNTLSDKWTKFEDISIGTNKQRIQDFIGFLQTTKTNENVKKRDFEDILDNVKTYAITKLESSDEINVLSFDSKLGLNFQDEIKLKEDILGCGLSIFPTDSITDDTSIDSSLPIGNTDSPKIENSTSVPTNKTSDPEPHSHTTKHILFWILIVIVLIGLLLFVTMASIVGYMKYKKLQKRGKESTKK